MFAFKLQIGCLLIVLYFIVIYIKGTYDKRIPCNPIFDALMYVAPWAIVFDGVTAWTVNHLDIVPNWVNMTVHGLFFVLMVAVIIILYIYMLSQMVGNKEKRWWCHVCAPGVVSLLLILFFIKDVKFLPGETTNYSSGISVIICFASLGIHFLIIGILICIKHRTLPKNKIVGILSFMLIILLILLIQLIFPEILISSMAPTVALVGIYMNFEDPSYRRLLLYNADMVTGFATLVENRDGSTGGHIRRTKGYVQIILNEMRKVPRYKRILTSDYLENVINAAPMHDVGKISTPDYILQKPGKLTAEEYEIMKQHAVRGGEIIQKTFADLDSPEYRKIAYEVARYHHEKWNGKGYPEGLKEKQIPLHARIMAIADVFDAVSAKRCYRDAMPIDACFKIIEEGAGVDFDPALAKLFLGAKKEILDFIEEDNEKELYRCWTE